MIYRLLFLFLLLSSSNIWTTASVAQSPSPYPELTQEVWETMGKPAEEQFKADAIILFHTLFPQTLFQKTTLLSPEELAHDKQARDFLKRLIITIAFKGVHYTSTMNGTDLKPYPHNIASLFGHGGRIMVTLKGMQIRDGKTAKGFLNYLSTGDFFEKSIILHKRQAASHAMHYDFQQNRYIEDKLKTIAQTAKTLYYGMVTHQHLGIDFPVGGIGNKLNGNTIWARGEHRDANNQSTGMYLGHLYLFTKDEKKMARDNIPVSGLLIGLEPSGIGKKNVWGSMHNIQSGRQDASKLRGVFGSNKWGMLTGIEKPNLYGGKILELTLGELYELDHYIEKILALPEEEQKKYFWYFLNNVYGASRAIFNR